MILPVSDIPVQAWYFTIGGWDTMGINWNKDVQTGGKEDLFSHDIVLSRKLDGLETSGGPFQPESWSCISTKE